MTDYEKAIALWQQKNITTDAELAEALNGHSIDKLLQQGIFAGIWERNL